MFTITRSVASDFKLDNIYEYYKSMEKIFSRINFIFQHVKIIDGLTSIAFLFIKIQFNIVNLIHYNVLVVQAIEVASVNLKGIYK